MLAHPFKINGFTTSNCPATRSNLLATFLRHRSPGNEASQTAANILPFDHFCLLFFFHPRILPFSIPPCQPYRAPLPPPSIPNPFPNTIYAQINFHQSPFQPSFPLFCSPCQSTRIWPQRTVTLIQNAQPN